MRILIPTIEPMQAPGGVARYIQAIQATFPKDVNVIKISKEQGRVSMLRQLYILTNSTDRFFVHHIFPIGTFLYLLSFLTKRSYVIFFHGMDFDLAKRNAWKRFLSRRIIKRARQIVTNSQALSDEVHDFMPRREKPLTVYPCVSDALVEASNVIRKHTRAVHDIHLLTVSRLIERKGHRVVLDAISSVMTGNSVTNQVTELPVITYVIVGDGSIRRSLQERVKTLGLEEHVVFLGAISEKKLAQTYANADIFIMPSQKTQSDREGFGIVYLEAQLFGLPVIALNTPGVAEAVKGGILLDSADKLAETILLLGRDKLLADELGRCGREFVLTNFTRERQFKKLAPLVYDV